MPKVLGTDRYALRGAFAFILISSPLLAFIQKNVTSDAHLDAGLSSWSPGLPVCHSPSIVLQQHNQEFEQQRHAIHLVCDLLAGKIKVDQIALESAERQVALASARLAALEKPDPALSPGVKVRDPQIKPLKADLKQLRWHAQNMISVLSRHRQQLADLQETSAALGAEGETEHELGGANDHPLDVPVANNLRIIDVHQEDFVNDQHRFGRLFYVQGKALVFSVYTLGTGTKLDKNGRISVWGQKGEIPESAKILGIFLPDAAHHGRWLAAVDDPVALVDIDELFVLNESDKQARRKPGMNRLFTVYLRSAQPQQ